MSRSATPAASDNPITVAIMRLRAEYVGSGKYPSHWAINNGACYDFADDICEQLENAVPDIMVVESANFLRDAENNPFTKKWDWALLRKHWNATPPQGLTAKQVDTIEFGGHWWITDGTRHYDAECPQGVESLFGLPIFRRYIICYLRERGVPTADIETDDVIPSPRCPVLNPADNNQAIKPKITHSQYEVVP